LATLQVTNTCDEAVVVKVDSVEFTLEAGESRLLSFALDVNRQGKTSKTNVTIKAHLAVDRSIGDSATCSLGAGDLKFATISCVTKSSKTTLHINFSGSGAIAGLRRESAVTLASSGGLLGLALLGMLLGRAPRCGAPHWHRDKTLGSACAGSTFPLSNSCFFGETIMRPAILTLFCFVLLAGSASANGPVNVGRGTVRVVNNVDGAVLVRVNNDGASEVTLEPGASASFSVAGVNPSSAQVTVKAKLVGTMISTSSSTYVRPGQTVVATVTAPTLKSLAINFSTFVAGQQYQVGETKTVNGALLGRESGVVLASGGGLVSLLLLGFFLGRAPRCYEPRAGTEQDSEQVPIGC
jgi:hypothetical protein